MSLNMLVLRPTYFSAEGTLMLSPLECCGALLEVRGPENEVRGNFA